MSIAFPARDADFDAVSSIPAAVQTALFEALSFVGLLEDAAVVEALAASLLRLSHECDLALAGTHDDTQGVSASFIGGRSCLSACCVHELTQHLWQNERRGSLANIKSLCFTCAPGCFRGSTLVS